MSDDQIIQCFLQGQHQATNTVTEWIRQVVYSRRWTEGIFPEDIISESRLRCFLNLKKGKFKNTGSLKAYIQRTTHNTTVEILRNHLRHERSIKALKLIPPVSGATPESQLMEKEQVALARKLYRLMDEPCRALWRMFFREGLSYPAIAQRLNITEGTLRVRAFRCKEAAREIFQHLSETR